MDTLVQYTHLRRNALKRDKTVLWCVLKAVLSFYICVILYDLVNLPAIDVPVIIF